MIDPGKRGLPSDPELERLVLGGILVDPEAILELQQILKPDHFALRDHQQIYAAMLILSDSDQSIDRIQIGQHLGPERLQAMGGMSRLAHLDDGLPKLWDLPAMARRLVAIALQRATLSRLVRLYEAVEASDAESILPDLHDLTEAISAPREANEWLDAAGIADKVGGIEMLLRGVDQRGAIIPPWPRLATIVPGFLPGQFVIVAARPGVGKTIALSQIMMAAADRAIPCRMVSLEMLAEDVATRMACARSDVSLGRVIHGRAAEDEKRAFYRGFGELQALPVRIRDGSAFTVPGLAASLRREQGRVRCVLIDYIGLMDGPGRDSYQRVGAISRGLKQIAIQYQVCVIAAAQLNRQAPAENRAPELYDLRDAGNLEQDADTVIMLHELKEDLAEGLKRVDMIVRKQRRGGLGTVPMVRVGKFSRLEEV